MSSQNLYAKYPQLDQALKDMGLSDVDILPIIELAHSKVELLRKDIDPVAEQQEKELLKLVQQLHKNELEYNRNIETILKTYLYPLRAGVVKIKSNTVLKIFSNIDVLFGIHQDLLSSLSNAVEVFPTILIGNMFSKFVPHMQVYTQYVNNFSASLNTLNTERGNSKAFNQFLISCEESNPMPLEALLSFPLNRIPYYRGILTQILNATARNGPDYKNMIRVVHDLTELQEYVNLSKTQSDNMVKVFAIESRITGREYPLNDLHRAFIKEGPLHTSVNKKSKEYYLFLFNDILLTTKKLPQRTQYRYKSSYSLQYGKVASGPGFTIELTNSTTNENLTLVAPSAAVKEEWLQALEKTITAMERTRVYGITMAELAERLPEDVFIHPYINGLITHLEKHALDVPGLFRISGSSNTINSVISQVNRGIKVDISQLDYHVVSGLLKQFLRTMKEPLFPFSMFEELCQCKFAEDPVIPLRELIMELPIHNSELLKRLMQMLVKVAKYSDVNKMTTSNIAIVIGPNLAREEIITPMGEISLTTTVAPLVQIMLQRYDEIFPKDPPPKFAKAIPISAQLDQLQTRTSVLSSDGALMGARRLKNTYEGSPSAKSSTIRSATISNTPSAAVVKPNNNNNNNSNNNNNNNNNTNINGNQNTQSGNTSSGHHNNSNLPNLNNPSIVTVPKPRPPQPRPRPPVPPPRSSIVPKPLPSILVAKTPSDPPQISPRSPTGSGSVPTPQPAASPDSTSSPDSYYSQPEENYVDPPGYSEVDATSQSSLIPPSEPAPVPSHELVEQTPIVPQTAPEEVIEDIVQPNFDPDAMYCARCQNVVSEGDEFIEACGKTFHNDCFTCHNCNGSLANGFFKRNDNPVCRTCRNLIGKA